MSFVDKVIVITGASEGIGAELARQLAPEKPKLVLAARRLDLLQAVVAQCEAAGAEAIAVHCDVGVEGDCKALAESAVVRFGRIDILVNNAGVAGYARLDDVSNFKWYEDIMRVNFMGSVWCTRYALAELKKSKGLVAGIPGLAAKVGLPGCTAYSPSKFAQAGFFEALRIELLGSGVDVTVVFPSFIATNLLRHGYGADGKLADKSSLADKNAMPVEDCARQMIAALRGRKRELVITTRAKIELWLKLLAPRVVDNMVHAALKKRELLAQPPDQSSTAADERQPSCFAVEEEKGEYWKGSGAMEPAIKESRPSL
jgi:short-subunit dehydrogenase